MKCLTMKNPRFARQPKVGQVLLLIVLLTACSQETAPRVVIGSGGLLGN